MEENKIEFKSELSSNIILKLKDELGKDKLDSTIDYKELCKNIPQNLLFEFLGWFGQEAIKRYIHAVNNPQKLAVFIDDYTAAIAILPVDKNELANDYVDWLLNVQGVKSARVVEMSEDLIQKTDRTLDAFGVFLELCK